jgi:transcription elongation factor GreA
MNDANRNLSLSEAARRFLTSLSSKEREASQQEVYKFVRWYGWEQPVTGLRAPEVANYAERLSSSDTDYAGKFELIKAFLVYAKKEGWVKINLAAHFKARKGKSRVSSSAGRALLKDVPLTRQGYAELEAELVALKNKRPQVIEEVRRAAADKDIRENAPLEAARERLGQLEGRIKELEGILKVATIIDEKQKVALKAALGSSIILSDMVSGEELRYILVTPREVNPAQGKISSESPIGRAIIGRREGEIVELTVPAGKLCYQIKQIGR